MKIEFGDRFYLTRGDGVCTPGWYEYEEPYPNRIWLLHTKLRFGYSLEHIINVTTALALESRQFVTPFRVREDRDCMIEQCLLEHKGNIQATLDSLLMPRRTLNQKMSKYGLDRKDFLPEIP